MPQTSPAYMQFWGKAHPTASPPAPQSHPVAYHLLDVAAVVDAILEVRPRALSRVARLLRVPEPDAKSLLVVLAAFHDLGKFAPAFQAKEPALWPEILQPLAPEQALPGVHTADGLVLWTDAVRGIGARATERLWPGANDVLETIAPAIFGHHGRPVVEPAGGAKQRFQEAALQAAHACADDIISLLAPEPLRAPPPRAAHARVASWWIAGLMTTADWIGSGAHWFPYTEPLANDPTLALYWERAKRAASVAVREAGLVATPVASRRSFAELTRSELAPTPAQVWAEDVVLPVGPCLVVIEDVTGAGKTETAQILLHRLMVEARASGSYWAMPTMATANAMFERQGRMLAQLYAEGADPKPSLVLAHGKQMLHEVFRATVFDGAAGDPAAAAKHAASPAAGREDGEGMTNCAAFLADDRRAALLADVGSGTIDQALLGVLPSRFNAMRLFGIADKVLVVDEAHAYDAYMGIELQELLRFQAALGGCAVVLSATLPCAKRAEMVKAWAEGLEKGGWGERGLARAAAERLGSDAYPLATLVGTDGVREEPLGAAEWSGRTVGVRFVHELENALAHVAEMAGEGAAVTWIRNTVNDCLEAAQQLREKGIENVMVFHARFAQHDRQTREAEVMERFGKGASAEAKGWVLIATQVVEQSLDLDFDVMLSDIAPIDLLIQRAGRLWRHRMRDPDRPAGCEPELVVLAPAPDLDPPKDWLAGIFEGSAAVYEHAGVLWRTVQCLAEVGCIETPSGLRNLIEGVYGSNHTPTGLEKSADKATAKALTGTQLAVQNTLSVADGYNATGATWLSEVHVPTRLGEEQITLRLARVAPDGALVSCAEGIQPACKAWALSEVRVRPKYVPHGAKPLPEHRDAANAARREWGRYEQEFPIVPLMEDQKEAGVWRGVLLSDPKSREILVRYSTATGLAFNEPAASR